MIAQFHYPNLRYSELKILQMRSDNRGLTVDAFAISENDSMHFDLSYFRIYYLKIPENR